MTTYDFSVNDTENVGKSGLDSQLAFAKLEHAIIKADLNTNKLNSLLITKCPKTLKSVAISNGIVPLECSTEGTDFEHHSL